MTATAITTMRDGKEGRDMKIWSFYKDFIIQYSRGSWQILNLNGEFLRRCKTKAEAMERIDTQTV